DNVLYVFLFVVCRNDDKAVALLHNIYKVLVLSAKLVQRAGWAKQNAHIRRHPPVVPEKIPPSPRFTTTRGLANGYSHLTPGRSSLCAVNKQNVVAVASQSGAWKESTGRTNMPWASTHIVHLEN
ncbi:MAG: hypothetical protein SOY69_04130, partial [Alloprevotella sp.]|nr:hypothetical protein [Alloprevotella sp.]